MTDDLGGLRHLVGDGEVLGELGGSSRSRVYRVRAGDSTVIVKRYLAGGGFAREAAALGVLPDGAPAPRLLGESTEPAAVVISDAGTGRSLADELLGDDPVVARAGLRSWARAIGRLHGVTVGRGEAFAAALAARTDEPVATLGDSVERAVTTLGGHCAELGVAVPAGAWDDLRALHGRLGGGPAVLSPGDTCPDNNVDTPDGRVLIDFESAQFHHPAWDVAYLVVPWPSCWCAWQLPEEASAQAVREYQLTTTLPWAASAAFAGDVRAAAVAWSVLSTSWFLDRALRDDPPPADPARPMPCRRAQILNRLRLATAGGPALGPLAAGLRDALTHRWGETPLPYAPAFTPPTGY